MNILGRYIAVPCYHIEDFGGKIDNYYKANYLSIKDIDNTFEKS